MKPDKIKKGEAKFPPSKKPRKNKSRDVIMDEQIWKKLPENIFEAVIARLPVATILRFRLISHNWNSMLLTRSFNRLYADVYHRFCPWFYIISHESKTAMYDPLSKKWYRPPLPPNEFLSPVTSAQGLVCFLGTGFRKFFICNPLNKSIKSLPPISGRYLSYVSVGMVPNGISNYNILWLDDTGGYEVYDSASNIWSLPNHLPSCIKCPLKLKYRSQTLSIDRVMYFMRGDPEGLIIYDIESHVWKQLVIPVPLHSNHHTLARCRNRVMLVGLVSKNAATCVCIWELQNTTLLWNEVDRMPNTMCLEFYGKSVQMSCLGNKEWLLLWLYSRQISRLIAYDVLKKVWHNVPDCELPGYQKRLEFACGTTFEPCINTAT